MPQRKNGNKGPSASEKPEELKTHKKWQRNMAGMMWACGVTVGPKPANAQ